MPATKKQGYARSKTAKGKAPKLTAAGRRKLNKMASECDTKIVPKTKRGNSVTDETTKAKVSGAVAMLNVEKTVEKYIELRDKRDAIMEEAKKKCAGIDDVLAKVEARILQFLESTGGENFGTAKGTAYKSERVSVTVASWEDTFPFIQRNGLWHMLEKRVSKAAVMEYADEHGGNLPPGLNVRKEVTLRVRRKTEPKSKD